MLNIKYLFRVNFFNQSVFVRTCSEDYEVARMSLGNEFDDAIKFAPNETNFIIDAGGYIGTSAIKFAKSFPNAQIICIEPSSENYEVLLKNISDFPNIVPIQAAVSAQSGASVVLRDRKTGNWGFTIVEEPEDSFDSNEIQKVKTITIDDILKQFNKTEIGILKLDIEGAELEVFQNSAHWIGKINVLTVELHDRIKMGCSSAFYDATKGRKLIPQGGEKMVSVTDHSN